MNTLVRICFTLVFTAVICLLFSSSLYSAPAAGASKTPAKSADNKETSGFVTNAGSLITIGGGYYMPMGEMATYLKPTWSVKVTYQENHYAGTPIGFGCDLIYAYPPDKEVYGGLMLVTAAPHVSLIIPFFNMVDLQFKAGPGLTVLNSILEKGMNTSADMTLHCGANVSRVFAGAFYVGLGSDYYYIFERKNLRTLNSWFAMGYRW